MHNRPATRSLSARFVDGQEDEPMEARDLLAKLKELEAKGEHAYDDVPAAELH